MTVLDRARSTVQGLAQRAMMKEAVELAPEAWLPGGKPDPLIDHRHGLIGAAMARVDGGV